MSTALVTILSIFGSGSKAHADTLSYLTDSENVMLEEVSLSRNNDIYLRTDLGAMLEGKPVGLINITNGGIYDYSRYSDSSQKEYYLEQLWELLEKGDVPSFDTEPSELNLLDGNQLKIYRHQDILAINDLFDLVPFLTPALAISVIGQQAALQNPDSRNDSYQRVFASVFFSDFRINAVIDNNDPLSALEAQTEKLESFLRASGAEGNSLGELWDDFASPTRTSNLTAFAKYLDFFGDSAMNPALAASISLVLNNAASYSDSVEAAKLTAALTLLFSATEFSAKCSALNEVAFGSSDAVLSDAWLEAKPLYCETGSSQKLLEILFEELSREQLGDAIFLNATSLVLASLEKYLAHKIEKQIIGSVANAKAIAAIRASIVVWSIANVIDGYSAVSNGIDNVLDTTLASHLYREIELIIERRENLIRDVFPYRLKWYEEITVFKKIQSVLMGTIWERKYHESLEANCPVCDADGWKNLELFSAVSWAKYIGNSAVPSEVQQAIEQRYEDSLSFHRLLYQPKSLYDGLRSFLRVASPTPPINQSPVAAIEPELASVTLGSVVALNASSTFDTDGDDLSFSWILSTPPGSQATLITATGSSTEFIPDVEGGYSVKLIATDGQLTDEETASITVAKNYSPSELLIVEDDKVYIEDVDVEKCKIDNVGIWTVPDDEAWKSVKFIYDSEDVTILINNTSGQGNEFPSFRDELQATMDCEPPEQRYPKFKRNFQHNFVEDRIAEWNRTNNPLEAGEKLYISLFSLNGYTSSEGINSEVKVDLDKDGDGVPDDNEDAACVNNPNESFDSDDDGFCDNEDKFDNDPAASVDSDDDGYPDAWNLGKSASDSLTGLVLDHPSFVNVASEWADSDEDGIGDNADQFDDDPAAALDSDSDGAPDYWNTGYTEADSITGLREDKFDNDPAASVDDDNDERPDRWNFGHATGDSTTGLTLDLFPMDSGEWSDDDLDGVGNNSDWAPDDPSEWSDSDGDGVGDNADPAPSDSGRSTNTAPQLTTIQARDMAANSRITIEIVAIDADSDAIRLELLSGPRFANLVDNRLEIFPESRDAGQYSISIGAYDDYGGVTRLAFFLVVNPINSGQLTFASNSISVPESISHAMLSVLRSDGAQGEVSVYCFTTDGTSVAGQDYSEVGIWLDWGDGDSSAKTCSIPIIDDLLEEPTEELFVDLSNPTNGSMLGVPDRATLHILDNESNNGAIDRIGVFRTSTARFFLDADASYTWSSGDYVRGPFGARADVPLVGDWNGNGVDTGAIFRPSDNRFYFDLNGDGKWDVTDTKSAAYGLAGDMPVVGDWDGDGADNVGVYRASKALFFLDTDGSKSWSSADQVVGPFGLVGDTPIIGDWNGDGTDDVGLFRPSNRKFYLDYDGSRSWTSADRVSSSFGSEEDQPIVGDWDGDGTDDLGVFRPGNRRFFLDVNGSMSWDSEDVGTTGFGKEGDLPVSGRW